MNPWFVGIFLTFVLGPIGLWSAPHSEAPAGENIDPVYEVEDPELMENVSLTEVKKNEGILDRWIRKFDRENYYHSYRQGLYPHIGAVIPFVDSTEDDPDKDSDDVNLLLGFYWELPKRVGPKWEAGLAWTTMSLGQLNVLKKHSYNERGAFRPFYRYGLTLKIDPDEELATISNFENFIFRAGVGFESTIRPAKSVRVDLDLGVGPEDIWLMFHYGYMYSW